MAPSLFPFRFHVVSQTCRTGSLSVRQSGPQTFTDEEPSGRQREVPNKAILLNLVPLSHRQRPAVMFIFTTAIKS